MSSLIDMSPVDSATAKGGSDLQSPCFEREHTDEYVECEPVIASAISQMESKGAVVEVPTDTFHELLSKFKTMDVQNKHKRRQVCELREELRGRDLNRDRSPILTYSPVMGTEYHSVHSGDFDRVTLENKHLLAELETLREELGLREDEGLRLQAEFELERRKYIQDCEEAELQVKRLKHQLEGAERISPHTGDLLTKIQTLSHELSEAQTRLHDKEEAMEDLEIQFDEVRREKNGALMELQRVKESVDEIMILKNAAEERCEMLRVEKDAEEQRSAEVLQLTSDLQFSEEQVSTLKSKLSLWRDQFSCDNPCVALSSQQEAVSKMADSHKSKIAALEGKCADLEQRLGQRGSMFSGESDESVIQKLHEFRGLKDENEYLRSQLCSCRLDREAAVGELADYQTALGGVTSLEGIRSLVTRLEGITSLEGQNQSLESENRILLGKIDSYEELLASSRSTERHEADQARSQLDKMSIEIRLLEECVVNEREKAENAEKTVKEYRQMASKAESDSRTLRADIETQESNMTELQHDTEELKSLAKENEAVVGNLKAELLEKEQEIADLHADLKLSREVSTRQAEDVSEITSARAQAESQALRLTKTNLALQQQLQLTTSAGKTTAIENESTVARLNNELSLARVKLGEAEAQLAKYLNEQRPDVAKDLHYQYLARVNNSLTAHLHELKEEVVQLRGLLVTHKDMLNEMQK